MTALLWALGATGIVSLISLVGVFALALSPKFLDKIIFLLVGLSAGALMGGAFLHLIPESAELSSSAYIFVLCGFVLFFFIERILHWHHCHKQGGKCKVHTFTYMNLIGDGIHNLIDGLLIAASFVVDINLGIVTTLAVIAHEIPQELGDFGVLVYGGFSRWKALLLNFLSATFAILGAVIGYFASSITGFTSFLVPLTAGGFIYIAASDLIPELHKEPKLGKAMASFAFFLIGIGMMYGLGFLF